MSEPLPPHLERPHVRPFQPIPVQKDGKQLAALRDPTMLQNRAMVVPPPAVAVIQKFQGEKTIDEVAAEVGAPVDQLLQLVQGLDQLGMVWGPTFTALENERREELRAAGTFPQRASGSLGEDEAACRAQIDAWFDDSEDPELDASPVGIVAPHLDYARGWPNYAGAYYPLRGMTAPDRVVILGTNHFGLGDGVVLTEFGFTSPMGRCDADAAVIAGVMDKLGRPVVVDQLDHLAEHSIELQLPWIQYCFGNAIPVVAALMPDPLVDMIEDDGNRVSGAAFVDALRSTLGEVGGTTFYVASSDLSHVGPQFGEPRPVDDQRRVDVERHDRDMMSKYLEGNAEDFIAAMKWTKNPTRWCSVGNMAALLDLAEPDAVELIDYRQAYDERGMLLVSSAAMALVRE